MIRNITFSPEYAASVEQKQIAEQTAQQAKLTVEQRRQEAEQARQVAQGAADAVVIAAKGDAESRHHPGSSRSPGFGSDCQGIARQKPTC